MHVRSAALLPLLALALAGCLAAPPGPGGPGAGAGPALLDAVLQGPGGPLPLAVLEARDAEGRALWLASSGLDGRVRLAMGPEVAQVVAWHGGATYTLGPGGELRPAPPQPAPLRFREPVSFAPSTFPLQLGTTCTEKADGDLGCGLDEPSIVVDPRGRVFYTAACCFLVSSPVWASTDGGATFQPLAHPVKDAYGSEGDLAVDAEGNLYYMDIDLLTYGIARWNPDLTPAYAYRTTGVPVVDRPWIRAGAGGVVHAVYNTGPDTVAYRSTDYARTFSPVPEALFGSGLARAWSAPGTGMVGLVGSGAHMMSLDDGASWAPRAPVEGCDGAVNAAPDAAGTVWFEAGGCVVGLAPGGAFGAPSAAIPEGIAPFFTWLAAGAAGGVALAFYGQVRDAERAAALGLEPEGWYLFASVSLDADRAAHWATVLADPAPLGHGALGRRLGDFMQVAVGPDGAVHLAYAANPDMDDAATAMYLRTEPVPALAPPPSAEAAPGSNR